MILEGISLPDGFHPYLQISENLHTVYRVHPIENIYGEITTLMLSVRRIEYPMSIYRHLDMIRYDVRSSINAYTTERADRLVREALESDAKALESVDDREAREALERDNDREYRESLRVRWEAGRIGRENILVYMAMLVDGITIPDGVGTHLTVSHGLEIEFQVYSIGLVWDPQIWVDVHASYYPVAIFQHRDRIREEIRDVISTYLTAKAEMLEREAKEALESDNKRDDNIPSPRRSRRIKDRENIRDQLREVAETYDDYLGDLREMQEELDERDNHNTPRRSARIRRNLEHRRDLDAVGITYTNSDGVVRVRFGPEPTTVGTIITQTDPDGVVRVRFCEVPKEKE